MLRDMNPLCQTKCSRSWQPNDQGSVEVNNKLVKQTLENVRITMKSEDQSNTWPNLLPRVTSILNTFRTNRKTSYSAYEAVFHRSFDDDSRIRDEVLRLNPTYDSDDDDLNNHALDMVNLSNVCDKNNETINLKKDDNMSTDINIDAEEEEVICVHENSTSYIEDSNCKESNIKSSSVYSVQESLEEMCSSGKKTSHNINDNILPNDIKPLKQNKACLVSRPRYNFSRRGITRNEVRILPKDAKTGLFGTTLFQNEGQDQYSTAFLILNAKIVLVLVNLS